MVYIWDSDKRIFTRVWSENFSFCYCCVANSILPTIYCSGTLLCTNLKLLKLLLILFFASSSKYLTSVQKSFIITSQFSLLLKLNMQKSIVLIGKTRLTTRLRTSSICVGSLMIDFSSKPNTRSKSMTTWKVRTKSGVFGTFPVTTIFY